MEILISSLLGITFGVLTFFIAQRVLPIWLKQNKLLPGVISALVLLVFLRVGYEFFQKNSKIREATKNIDIILQHESVRAFIGAIKKNDPPSYDRFRENIINRSLETQNYADSDFLATAFKDSMAFWTGYFDRASTQAILKNLDSQITLLRDLNSENPDEACRLQFPLIFGQPNSAVLEKLRAYSNYLASLEEIIKSAQSEKGVAKKADNSLALQKFQVSFRSKNPKEIAILGRVKTINSVEEKRELSKAGLKFLEEMRQLPENEAVTIYSSMFRMGQQ